MIVCIVRVTILCEVLCAFTEDVGSSQTIVKKRAVYLVPGVYRCDFYGPMRLMHKHEVNSRI